MANGRPGITPNPAALHAAAPSLLARPVTHVPASLRLHCAACGATLTALERYDGGLCHDWRCRHRRDDARQAADFDQRQVLAREAAAQARPDLHDELVRAPVVTVRLYDVGLAPVPALQRAALKDHLLAMAPAVLARVDGACMERQRDAEAQATAAPADAPQAVPPSPTAAAVDALLGQVCAACTGHCCRVGRSRQAFLDEDTMTQALQDARLDDPAATYGAVVQTYLDAVAPMHHEGSCAFHGARGCTLPRARRADICNRFECPTLKETRAHAEQRGLWRVYLVRHDRDAGWSGRSLGGFVPPLA